MSTRTGRAPHIAHLTRRAVATAFSYSVAVSNNESALRQFQESLLNPFNIAQPQKLGDVKLFHPSELV